MGKYVVDLLGKNGRVVYDFYLECKKEGDVCRFVMEMKDGSVEFGENYMDIDSFNNRNGVNWKDVVSVTLEGKIGRFLHWYKILNVVDGECVDITEEEGDKICCIFEKEFGYVGFLDRYMKYLGDNGKKIFESYIKRYLSVGNFWICKRGMWEYYRECMRSICECDDGEIYLMYENGSIKITGDVSDEYMNEWVDLIERN